MSVDCKSKVLSVCRRLPSIAVVIGLCLAATLTHAATIPASSLKRLQRDLAATEEIESTLQQRRHLKRVIRSGESLFEQNAKATNRFAVLAIVFEGRQMLFTVDDSDRNRDELLETCRMLVGAPDDQAQLRLPADTMRTQVDIAHAGGDANETAKAISNLVVRYEGTAAEAESLVAASEMAMDAGDATLLRAIRATLGERFADVPEIAAFMRERYGTTRSVFVFRGEFTRADGTVLKFPIDVLGRPFVACFWSADAEFLDEKMLEIKAVQEKYPNRFVVYSFNLDELKDHGQSMLTRLGLDWIPMELPGGVRNAAYLQYAHFGATPFAFVAVNEMGVARGKSNRTIMPSAEQDISYVLAPPVVGVRDPAYFARLESLLIGDFLVDVLPTPGTNSPARAVPGDKLQAIQECFAPPETRCILSGEAALANYRKAEDLCTRVIKVYPDATDLFLVRNRRIVALMGMWKLSGKAEHLGRALEEAHAALSAAVPKEQRVVPSFCVARHAIRQSTNHAATAQAEFNKACGGKSYAAQAAALVLALDAGELRGREPHVAWARVTQGRPPWDIRDYRQSAFNAEFTTLGGRKISFPKDTGGKHNIVVFVEGEAEGADAKLQQEYVRGLHQLVATHRHKEVKMLVVLFADDAATARSVVSNNNWTCEATFVQGGACGPAAVSFGAFGQNIHPKTYLIDPDGNIKGTYGGYNAVRGNATDPHMRHFLGRTASILRSVKGTVYAHDGALGIKALAANNYAEAANRLESSFPGIPTGYRSQRLQVQMGLKDWNASLKASNDVIRYCKKAGRPYFLTGYAGNLTTRATIFDNLGKKNEAAGDRKLASELNSRAADVWEARVVTMVKQGQAEGAQRWRVEARRARARASSLAAPSRR